MRQKERSWRKELKDIFWAMSLDDRKDPILWYEKEGKFMMALAGGMAFCTLLSFYIGEWRGGLIYTAMFSVMFFFGIEAYLGQKQKR